MVLADTESGADAGSNLYLANYHDAGGQIGVALEVVRATGQVIASHDLTVTGTLTANGSTILTTHTPSSSSDTGTTGQIAWDSSYIYICTATNTWKRVAIATW